MNKAIRSWSVLGGTDWLQASHRLLVFLGLFWGGLWSIAASAEEKFDNIRQGGTGAEFSTNFSLPEREDAVFSNLVHSIIANRKFSIPRIESSSSLAEWEEWKENFYNIVGDVHEINLYFEQTSEESNSAVSRAQPEESTTADGFTVHLQFELPKLAVDRTAYLRKRFSKSVVASLREGFVVRHDHPALIGERGGFRVDSTKPVRQGVFLSSSDLRGVLVLLPPSESEQVLGALLCPRDLEPNKIKLGAKRFPHRGFVLTKASASVNALAQAAVETGFGPGYARALIQVTPNIPRSDLYIDESINQYPYVSVEYNPSKQSELIGYKKNLNFGVRLETVHHNSLNHVTTSVGTVRVTLREVHLPERVPFRYQSGIFSAEPGPCWALLKESSLDHVHGKKDIERSHLEYSKRHP